MTTDTTNETFIDETFIGPVLPDNDMDITKITDAEEAIVLQYEATKAELARRRDARTEINGQIRALVAEVIRLAKVVRVIDATRISADD